MSNGSSTMLTEAIAAARAGDRSRAKDLLSRLLRSDSTTAEYWIWMSAVVDSRREQIYCLESALNLDSTNRAALRGLTILGARKPDNLPKTPPKLPRRRLSKPSSAGTLAKSAGLNMRFILTTAGLLGGLGVIGLIVAFVLTRGSGATVLAPTLPPPTPTFTPTPPEPTATNTPIPVETRILRTPIPLEAASTPIVMLVPQTPTPTPLVGLTPHPSYEAYSAGISALESGEFEAAIDFLEQVIGLDDSLPDVHYFHGEALRRSGSPGLSIRSYDRAILADETYAPAYLGRALAQLEVTLRERGELRPADLPGDFDRALEQDPQFLQAYEAKASFLADHRLWKTLEETMQLAVESGVTSPIIYIRMSQAQYQRERYEQALENAIVGSAGDPTNLDGYLALGRAHVIQGEYESALWPLQTYIVYRPEDEIAWGTIARALYETGDPNQAYDTATLAIELNDRYAPAYMIRGEINLDRGEYDQGLVDFQRARQYGATSLALQMNFGRAYYFLGDYVEALQFANIVISESEDPSIKAEGYALRATVYEATNPPLIEEAIQNWQWILELPEASPEIRTQAETHLALLGAPTDESPDVSPEETSSQPGG